MIFVFVFIFFRSVDGGCGGSWPSVASISCAFSSTDSPVSVSSVHHFCDFRFLYCNPDFLRLDSVFLMQQQPVRFRPVHQYRPLISLTPTSSFILAGGGQAVLIQLNIPSFLYNSDTSNPDIRAFGLCAPAVKLVTQSWTQVDTPSVSSRTQQHGFWE